MARGRHRAHVPGLARALTVRPFRALLAAQTLSSLGDELARLALAVLVFARTGSPVLTAATFAVSFLPWLLLGPRLATLGDRFPRRGVLIGCDLVRAVLAVALATQGLPIPVLLALVALLTAAEPPFDATRAALLADLLEGEDYVAGQALMQSVVAVLTVAGYGVGGVVVAAVGAHGAFLLDAASFLASAALLLALPATSRPATQEAPGRDEDVGGRRSGRRSGWTVVREDPRVRWLLVLTAGTSMFDVVPVGLVVPWAVSLGGGSRTAGLLAAAAPLGAVMSALVLVRALGARRRLQAVPWLAAGSVAVLGLALLRPPTVAALALLLVSGCCSGYSLVANQLFVQAVPGQQRAAAFGVAGSVLVGAQGLGLLLAGAAAEFVSPSVVVGVAGVLGTGWVLALGLRRPELDSLLPAPAGLAASAPPAPLLVPPEPEPLVPDRVVDIRVVDITDAATRARATLGSRVTVPVGARED